VTGDPSLSPAQSGASGPRAANRAARAGGLLILAGVLLACAAVCAALCTLIGRLELSWEIWRLRVSRVIVAAVVGAGLSVSGLALQGLLRNPLADPYVLGISSGAGVGYLVGLTLAGLWRVSELATTPVAALAGAIVTSAAVYALAQRRGRLDPYVLLLSGVIVNVLNGAIILSILIFLRSNDLVNYVGWGIGQIPDGLLWTRPALLAACAAGVIGGWGVTLARAGAMNVLGLGDEVAASSGVGVHGLRVETFLIVSLMTAAAVSLAGPVGFVGLVIPHVCRLSAGPDHRRLAVLSGFVGAIFLMAADTFCRTFAPVVYRGEIPLGVVTALVGGPVFIFLLRRRGREGGR
jgi:iron complex transport system permease protein